MGGWVGFCASRKIRLALSWIANTPVTVTELSCPLLAYSPRASLKMHCSVANEHHEKKIPTACGAGQASRTPPSKRRKRGDKSPSGPSASADAFPVPLTQGKGKSLDCGRCHISAEPGRWAFYDSEGKCVGNACARCWKACCSGNFEPGPKEWGSFCQKCEDDPAFDDQVNDAIGILEGEAMPHFPTEDVMASDRFDVTVTKHFIGMPRADFRSAAGMDPSEAGVAECDLKNERGQTFKGVLLQHPQRPWLEYALSFKTGVQRDKHHLFRGHHCREEFGQEVLDAQKEAHDSVAFVKKLRNCTTTSQDINTKVGKPVFEFPALQQPSAKEASAAIVPPSEIRGGGGGSSSAAARQRFTSSCSQVGARQSAPSVVSAVSPGPKGRVADTRSVVSGGTALRRLTSKSNVIQQEDSVEDHQLTLSPGATTQVAI